jgi:hypothetical protein
MVCECNALDMSIWSNTRRALEGAQYVIDLHRIRFVGLCQSCAEATLAGGDKRQSRGTDKPARMKLEGFECFEEA